MRDRKHRLITERDFMVSERQRIKEKFAKLYRHVFQVRNYSSNRGNPFTFFWNFNYYFLLSNNLH